ncbi:hypothetical protein RB195_020330 [Necator americanus]
MFAPIYRFLLFIIFFDFYPVHGIYYNNYTIFYHGFNTQTTASIMAIVEANESVLKLTLNIIYSVPHYQEVLINKQRCPRESCIRVIPKGLTFKITMEGDEENVIEFSDASAKKPLFYYRQCSQPTDNVKCRYRTEDVFDICICHGHMDQCSKNEVLIWKECTAPTPYTTVGISTSSPLPITVTSPTLPFSTLTSTLTSTTGSPSTTSSTATTPATSSSVLSTTPITTTTPSTNGTTSIASSSTAQDSTLPTSIIYTKPTTPPKLRSLKDLSVTEVSLTNISTVLNYTQWYAEKKTELKSDEIREIGAILEKCANLSGLPVQDSQNILFIMDCVLYANENEIEASGSAEIFLSILPMLAQNTNASGFNFLNGNNFAFTTQALDCSTMNGGVLMDLGGSFAVQNKSMDFTGNPSDSISLSLPDICENKPQASRTFMTIYRNRKLFVGPKKYNSYSSESRPTHHQSRGSAVMFNDEIQDEQSEDPQQSTSPPSPCSRQIALTNQSPVMSATVLDNAEVIPQLSSQKAMAILKFDIAGIRKPLHGQFRVTWWDGRLREWSTNDQCKTNVKGNAIVAQCEHLTDFTVVVDFALNDPIVCERSLIRLGHIANMLSIVSLAALVSINLCSYWSTMEGSHIICYLRGYAPPQKDFVSLAHEISLLFFYLIFALLSEQKTSDKECGQVAFVSYTLLMSSVLLTMFQGFRLISVFYTTSTYLKQSIFSLTAVSASLLIPFLVSALLFAMTDFFYRDDHFCWVRPDYILYAVIIPTSILIMNAIFCTTMVCNRLFFRRKLSTAVRHRDNHIVSKIVAVLLMQVSLGVPWVLQYPTLCSPIATPWHYIFTIVMGSQGTLLALLFFYKRRQSMALYRPSQRGTLLNMKEQFSSLDSSGSTKEEKELSLD